MKKLLTSDTAWKIYSVLIAILLWCAVMFTQNPERSRVIKNIPVKITNADAIEQAGYYLMPAQDLEIDLRVSGKKIYNVKAEDVIARVTVPTINPGEYELPISFTLPGSASIASRNERTILVTVEEKMSRTFDIQKEFVGISEKEGLLLKPQTDLNRVTLTGPKSVISNVATVSIDIQKEDVGVRSVKNLILKDERGKVLDASEGNITMDTTSVNLTMIQLASMEIQVEAGPTERLAPGYVVRSVQCAPDKVLLGTESNSQQWPAVLKTLPIDLAGQKQSFTTEVALEIPEGYDLLGVPNSVKVTVEIEPEA